MALPEDLLVLVARRKQFSIATLRKLLGQHGEERVRTAAAVLTQQYADDSKVKSFGALLSRAVQEGWTVPAEGKQGQRRVKEETLGAVAPPAGTRWAQRPDGELLEVLDVTSDVVRTTTGIIPKHHWAHWTWLSHPGAQENQETDAAASDAPDETAAAPDAGNSSPEEREATVRQMLTASVPGMRRLALRLAAQWGVAVEAAPAL